MNYQPLKYIYQPSGIPDAYTLLLLHGTGGDENDLLPFANHFGDGINILSLRGNVSEAGMAAILPITSSLKISEISGAWSITIKCVPPCMV